MTDWADEIAASLIHEGSSEGYDGCFNYFNEASEGEIAAALRKAKADGMREAAEIAHRLEDQFETAWRKGLKGDSHLEGMSDGASQVSDAIFETASKLSPT